MSGVFRLLVMAGPGLNQVPSAMNRGPLKIKQTAGLLFYFISSDDLSRDWFPLIQKPDSRMNVIGDMHVPGSPPGFSNDFRFIPHTCTRRAGARANGVSHFITTSDPSLGEMDRWAQLPCRGKPAARAFTAPPGSLNEHDAGSAICTGHFP